MDAGYADRFQAGVIHKSGLTSCLSTSRICAHRPLTLDSPLVVAGYAGRFRADFHHKCNLTSCLGAVIVSNYCNLWHFIISQFYQYRYSFHTPLPQVMFIINYMPKFIFIHFIQVVPKFPITSYATFQCFSPRSPFNALAYFSGMPRLERSQAI